MPLERIDLDELYNIYTSDEQMKESFEKRTVPTGKYMFVARRADAIKASDRSPWPGRKMASFYGALKDMSEGKTKGFVGFDASWETARDKRGKLDRPSMLWGQLIRALGLDPQNTGVGKVIEAGGSYPVSVYVTEAFKTPEGWRTARTPEQRREYRQRGFDGRNFVDSVSKVA